MTSSSACCSRKRAPIAARPDRDAVLVELKRIAVEEFGGHITRNMTTILYVARRFAAL